MMHNIFIHKTPSRERVEHEHPRKNRPVLQWKLRPKKDSISPAEIWIKNQWK